MMNADLTNGMDGNLAKIPAWSDNKMEFSHRMLDLAVDIGSR
jgi:glyceraldehyde-3-phosphate dehydrogenase/erythrose-4-phosphate dehydrogenase